MDDEQHLPKPGEVLAGKYRIERIIGKGGMGAVLAAQHELLGQRIAIKFLLGEIAQNPEAVARFNNEARNAFKIQSEHVCRVMDVGVERGMPFMVMEFLEGQDLSQILEVRGAFPVEDAVDYVLQGLEAIAQAHALGIVHRDLKPANLFLHKRTDGSTIVKVLDFGIAKASNPLTETGKHNLTSTKSMLGSPLYMSPEQLRSAKNVDARADIWALGVILYELLTGTVPFNGETLGELFIAILEQPPPPVVHRRGDVPQMLSDAVMRCLTRAQDQRFQNVAELAQALAPCAPARSYVSVERVSQALGMPKPATVSPDMRGPMSSFAGTAPGTQPHPLSSSQSGPQPAAFSSSQSGARQFQPQAGTQMLGSQTGNPAWGNTAGGGAQKSKAPLIAGAVVGGLLFLGIAAGGLVFALKSHSPTAKPTATEAPENTTENTTEKPSADPQTADTSKPATATAKTAEPVTPATTETAKVEPQQTVTGGGGGHKKTDPWARGGNAAPSSANNAQATATAKTNATPPPHATATAFDPLNVNRRGN